MSSFFVLIGCISSINHVIAADGNILTVNSNTVTASLNPGVYINSGDELDVSLDLGGEILYAGKLRVQSVQGNIVTAIITTRQMAVQKGMSISRINNAPSITSSLAAATNWQNPDQPSNERTVTQRTRPVKKESSIELLDLNAPIEDSGKAIQSLTTNSYSVVWTDKGSGARTDFATFRPNAMDGYYPLGDVAITAPWEHGRYAPPIFTSLLVKSGSMELAAPIGYSKTWDSRRSRSDVDFSTWLPTPAPGYTCMGEVGIASLDDKPPVDAIRCIPQSCVAEVPLGEMIWKDSGSGAKLDYSAWSVPGLTTYLGYASHRKPNRSAYTIKEECLN